MSRGVFQRFKDWWNNYTLIVPNGKNKRIIDLRDCTNFCVVGKIINTPEKRMVSPKGNSKFSVTLPDDIISNIINENNETEIKHIKLENENTFLIILSKPKVEKHDKSFN